jgi:CYTH domain-containing protein
MPVEIERKFLLTDKPPVVAGVEMVQGYLCKDADRTIRVRLERDEDGVKEGRAVLTVKGMPVGLTRPEYEYAIPMHEAQELMQLCKGSLVEKTRYRHQVGKHVWEVDVFHGENEGLVVAEIELSDEAESFDKPDWVGDEVSADPRYANSKLSTHPFRKW